MYSDSFIADMCQDGAILAYAAEFQFPNETLRNWSGVGNIVIDGETYYGVGEFGSIGSIENVGDANPASVELTLTGLPSVVFTSVMQANIRGTNATVMKVLLDKTGKLLNHARVVVGQVTEYSWSFNETGTFSIQVADEFSLYERPLQKFYTEKSWTSDHEGDHFWRFVAQLANKKLHWGAEQDGSKFTKNQ